MKVQTIDLKNFKRFHNKQLDFRNPVTGLARDLIVLVGPNGSGKSTVLQAIAATVGTATRRLESPQKLAWPGFDFDLAQSWRLPTRVDLTIEFSTDEIAATREYCAQIPDLEGRTEPGHNPFVRLSLHGREVRTDSPSERFQFLGRYYARQILKQLPEGFEAFKRVGTIFWYTEHRVATSLTLTRENGPSQEINLDLLRRRLSDLMQFHDRVRRGERTLRPGERDLFADLEEAYQRIFPHRRFDGPIPRMGIDDILAEPWFYLFDGHRQYELAEMSGGERAIFPLLFDFVNWNIHNSIILIDELELHLHPPMQQALLRALEKLGHNNQFIVTTHSDAVAELLPEETIVRLEED